MDNVIILPEAFNPYDLLQSYENEHARSKQFGATSVFVGSMRDFNEGDDVSEMFLEHYPGMTEPHLKRIIEEAGEKWDLQECLIAHRVGHVAPGETLMLAVSWSSHRKEAFDACRYLVEELKHRAPFWKKETLKDGEIRWVATNTPG